MILLKMEAIDTMNSFKVVNSKLQGRVNAGKAHTCARYFSEKETKYISELFYKLGISLTLLEIQQ